MELRSKSNPPNSNLRSRKRVMPDRNTRRPPFSSASIFAIAGAVAFIGAFVWFMIRPNPGDQRYWTAFCRLNHLLAQGNVSNGPREVQSLFDDLPISGVRDPELQKLHATYRAILEHAQKQDEVIGPRPYTDMIDKESMRQRMEWSTRRQEYVQQVDGVRNELLALVNRMKVKYGEVPISP